VKHRIFLHHIFIYIISFPAALVELRAPSAHPSSISVSDQLAGALRPTPKRTLLVTHGNPCRREAGSELPIGGMDGARRRPGIGLLATARRRQSRDQAEAMAGARQHQPPGSSSHAVGE
jgi:hypothetical protein